MLPDDLERRVVAELRAESTRIVGHAVILDVRSVDLAGFVDIVRPTAVARALRPESAVVALYNHDAGAVLGRQADDLGAGEGCARGLAFYPRSCANIGRPERARARATRRYHRRELRLSDATGRVARGGRRPRPRAA
jgi:hypothetical protein